MRVIVAFLMAAGMMPTAAAYPSCATATEASANPAGVYVIGDVWNGHELWREENLELGLQRQACLDGGGSLVLSDRKLLGVS